MRGEKVFFFSFSEEKAARLPASVWAWQRGAVLEREAAAAARSGRGRGLSPAGLPVASIIVVVVVARSSLLPFSHHHLRASLVEIKKIFKYEN